MDVTEILTHAPPPSVSYPALNPHTPLSYVSAGTATQMSIGSYVVVGSLAVLLWDILQNLPADLKILTQSRIRLPSIVYLVSRLLSLAHVLWSAVFHVSAIGNCADNLLGLSVLYPLSISASTLLLLCRMRLVYDDNLRVVGPFSVLWICVLGETITVPFGVEASAIGPTDRCIVSELRKFTLAAAMAPIVYDTAVYIAVAYRLTAAPCGKVSMREWVSGMFTGSHLVGVSKLIFEDSRLYYVVALSSNTLTAIMILANSISIPLRSAFFALNVTLVNIMACQAHRNMKLPMFQHPNFTTSEFSPPPTAVPRDRSSSCALPVRFRHTNMNATRGRNIRVPDNYTQHTYPGRAHNTLSGYKGHRVCSRPRVAVNVIPASPSSMTTSFGGEESTMDYWRGGDAQSMVSSHSGSGIPVYLPSEDSHRSAGKASSFFVI